MKSGNIALETLLRQEIDYRWHNLKYVVGLPEGGKGIGLAVDKEHLTPSSGKRRNRRNQMSVS